MRDTALRTPKATPRRPRLASRRTRCAALVAALLATPACTSCPEPAAPVCPPSGSAPAPAAEPQAAAPQSTPPAPAAELQPAADPKAAERAINRVLDDWHAAAAAADEVAYFGAFTQDAVFLGTDATERWDLAAFRAFARPFFARGKAWSFRAVRRDVIIDGRHAWFDEDLATPNLGPSRGSGVLRLQDGRWKIAHYNLALTIPNDALKSVKKAIEQQAAQAAPKPLPKLE